MAEAVGSLTAGTPKNVPSLREAMPALRHPWDERKGRRGRRQCGREWASDGKVIRKDSYWKVVE